MTSDRTWNGPVHWLRHAHASHALDRGADVHEIQGALGHASLATTRRYVHLRPERSSRHALACRRPKQRTTQNQVEHGPRRFGHESRLDHASETHRDAIQRVVAVSFTQSGRST